jgi:membrane protein
MREKIKTFIQRLRLLNNDREIEGNVLLWSFIKLFTGHQSLKQAAAALTYHTLFAIVPVTALMVAVTNLMGYGDAFREFIANILPGQEGIATEILTFADRYLTNRDVNYWIGAIVGLILLLYSLFSIFQTIDSSFNLLWNLKEHSLKKQLKVFLFVLLVPFVTTFLLAIWLSISSFFEGGFIREANIFVLTTIIYISLLFLAYKFIPNTKVNIRHAAASAVFCGVVFAIMQYCGSLIFNLFSNYKNVYGDLANFMLLILWIYFSWTICLAGSRWNYLLHEGDRLSIESKYRGMSYKFRKFLMVLLIGHIEKEEQERFTLYSAGKAMNAEYNIPPYITESLIGEMRHKGILTVDVSDRYSIDSTYKNRTVQQLLTMFESEGSSDSTLYQNLGIENSCTAERIWEAVREGDLQKKELQIMAKEI